jgi:hypothetical protein
VRHIVLNDAVRRPDFYNNNVKINCRGAQTITSAITRSELHARCRADNPQFAKTHGTQSIIVDLNNAPDPWDQWAAGFPDGEFTPDQE